MNPKPTLGYRSRQAAILAMYRDGKGAPEIARQIGTSTDYVRACIYRSGGAIQLKLFVPVAERRRLGRAAAARGLTASDLAGKIVAAVIADNLYNAVLDEGQDG